MLSDAVSRWAACAGLPTGQTCELQWSDLSVLVGLFLVADAGLSWFLRWSRALQDLPMDLFTPMHPVDPQHVAAYLEYSVDDHIETSDHRTAA
jgi:hypothetical protein